MVAIETSLISPKYHKLISDWQKKNFPELSYLEKNWTNYYPKQTPFKLQSRIGQLKSEAISVGRYKDRPYFEQANEMGGNMFFSAQGIVKAQCSTELGSVQQHRMSIDQAVTDEMKFGILRIMAEELRHAYQMFWVLEHDETWKRLGMGDVADNMIQELLDMQTGAHVLDAFNMEMQNFLDNTIFATFIDMVGKYQLDMQSVFAYAPMARSMGPMLQEEAFHLGHGKKSVRQIAVMAANQEGDFSIKDVQEHLNKWLARGLEMFGNESGGGTNVEFGFKDKTNGVAQAEYHAEVTGVVKDWNCALIQQVYKKGTDYATAKEIVEEDLAHQGRGQGHHAGDDHLHAGDEVLPQARHGGLRLQAVRPARRPAHRSGRHADRRRQVPRVPGDAAAGHLLPRPGMEEVRKAAARVSRRRRRRRRQGRFVLGLVRVPIGQRTVFGAARVPETVLFRR